jgi:hypothetical protein
MLQSLEVTILTFCLRDKDKKDKLGKERREESDEGKFLFFCKKKFQKFFHFTENSL